MTIEPLVAVDLPRLDANLRRFQQQLAATGVPFRAHVKAHRTVELAQRQVAAGAVGVSVHTASAAIRYAEAGIEDVVLAWPWPEPWRFPRFVEAAARVPRFAVHVDRPETITGLGAAAVERGVEVRVRIDLRHASAEAVPALGKLAADTPGVRLDGVTGYSPLETTEQLRDREGVGRRYAEQVVAAAEQLRDAGLDCPVVSIGGTPTALGAASVPGVTELCAGAYATLDGGLAAAGVGSPAEVAITVAADATDLLDGCSQPWEPAVAWQPAPDSGRLVPAHICPLITNLVKRGVEITAVAGGEPVASWRPFAAPDRE